MISIFNGRQRSLSTSTHAIYAQVSVELRQYLHLFHNGKNLNALGVFLAIALHADENGWAWPGRDMLMNETGIVTRDALAAALTWLRGMQIDGHPIIKQYRMHSKGRYFGSVYHLFPDSGGDPPANLIQRGHLTEWRPSHDHPDTVLPCPDQPDPDDHDCLKKNHLKEEPDHSAASGGVTIDLLKAIPTYESLSAQQKESLKIDCPRCGKLTKPKIRVWHRTTPCCHLPIVWIPELPMNRQARREKGHAKTIPKAGLQGYSPGCRYLTEQARLREDALLKQPDGTSKVKMTSGELDALSKYEQRFGERFIRDLVDSLTEKHGRPLIRHVINKLPYAASNFNQENGAHLNGIKQPESKPTLELKPELRAQFGLE